jgi:ribonuclease HII
MRNTRKKAVDFYPGLPPKNRPFTLDDIVCGVDEAGRGPLAGPVYAAAVILDPARPIEGLRDSKKLTEARRDELAPLIKEHALAWAIAECSHTEIDTLNILQATMLAMRRAVELLATVPTIALIDGNRCPQFAPHIRAHAVVEGDDKVHAISAASILAKTARDALMRELDPTYPAYGFAHNKGYGTPDHLAALDRFGPCAIHRRSFAPVLQISLPF